VSTRGLQCLVIALNIMFHAPMGRFQLELIYLYYLFELQLSTAQARRQKKLQHPTRLVENIALTTKGLQERKTHH
jgi:hypothetical protein